MPQELQRISKKDREELQAAIINAVRNSTFRDNIINYIDSSKIKDLSNDTRKISSVISDNSKGLFKDLVSKSAQDSDVSKKRQDKIKPEKDKKDQEKKTESSDDEKDQNNADNEKKNKSKGRQLFDAIFEDVSKTKGFEELKSKFTDLKTNINNTVSTITAPFKTAKKYIDIIRGPKKQEEEKSSTPSVPTSPQKGVVEKAAPTQAETQPQAEKKNNLEQPETKTPEPKINQAKKPETSERADDNINSEPDAEKPIKTKVERTPRKTAAKAIAESAVTEAERQTEDSTINTSDKSQPQAKTKKAPKAKKSAENIIESATNSAPKNEEQEESEQKTETKAISKNNKPKNKSAKNIAEYAAKEVEQQVDDTSEEAKQEKQPPAKTKTPSKNKTSAKIVESAIEPQEQPKENKQRVPQPPKETEASTPTEKKAPQKAIVESANQNTSKPSIDGSTALKEQKKESTALALSAEAKKKHGSVEQSIHKAKMDEMAEEAAAKTAEMEQERADHAEKIAMAQERADKESEHFKERGKQNKGILGFLNAEGLADKWKTMLTLKNHVLEMASSAKKFALDKAHALGSIVMKGAHAAAGAVKGAFMMPFPINLVALGLGGAAVIGGIMWAKKLLSGGGGGPPSASGGGEEGKEEKNPNADGPTPEEVAEKGDKDAAKKMAQSSSAMFSLILFEVLKQKQLKKMTDIMEEISKKLDNLSIGGGGTTNIIEQGQPPQQEDETEGVGTGNIFDGIRYSSNRTR